MSWWGIPRRAYREGKNVRVEHWRQGDPAFDRDDAECALPDHYAAYLQSYALWQCLRRPGPGQDLVLADYYAQRWTRQLARLERRRQTQVLTRTGQFGGGVGRPGSRPPRPQLPANYGSRTR